MNLRAALGGALAASLFVLILALNTSLAGFTLAAAATPQVSDLDTPPPYAVVVQQFTDAQIGRLLSTLDARLVGISSADKWGEAARMTLSTFSRRLQQSRLTAAQESRVLDHLVVLERSHPGEPALEDARFAITSLTVGKQAPDIVGKDLDGVDFRLSDYRGKVVVVMFWGEWCGICRTEYPYERLLLELYKNWPFAILGVNSDGSREVARQASSDNRLTYRSWWDGGGEPGSIAAAWHVAGWPTVYLIDGQGVIRFVDLGHEDLLKGVSQLLTEQTATADLISRNRKK